MSEVPDDRCGYTWPEDFDEDDHRVPIAQNSCCRKSLVDANRCAWHAAPDDSKEKTADSLRKSRVPISVRNETSGHAELLDGSQLSGVNLQHFDSFANVLFRDADLSDTSLMYADLSGAYLFGADLSKASLFDADLSEAKFHRADLSETKFFTADLSEADLHETDLSKAGLFGADLSEANFKESDLSGASLMQAELSGTDLKDADLSEATLVSANISEANLRGADLSEANCRGVVFSGVDLRDATFNAACDSNQGPNDSSPTLKDAQFEDGSDLRGTDFSGAKLYQTAFRDVRINDDTIFGIEDGNRGRACRYDYDPNATVSIDDDTDRLRAAAWTYRRLESLFDANAMDQRARNAHIRKEEAQRSQAKDSWSESRIGWFRDYLVPTVSYHLHRHGESVSRLLGASAILIFVCGLLYSVTGVARENPDTTFNLAVNELNSLPTVGIDLLNGLYFSIITFSTIGYGDYYPSSPVSQLLVGIESLAGAVFIALFVFVLGRRVAR